MNRSPKDTADVADLLGELVRIPSINPALDAAGGGEQEIASFCVDWLTRRGVTAWLEEAEPGRPNAVAHIGDGDGPALAICAHLDTVGVAGMEIPPFEPNIEAGRLYGRGSYDMKGGVAAAMAAAARLAPAMSAGEVPGALMLALVADEEHASLGARDFVQRHPTDACIVTEPSEGDLVLAHKGFVWAEITTTGRAAHGSRWEDGVSAIGRMGRIITALEEHDRSRLRERRHPLVGPASMHSSMISGGTSPSVYAEECRLTVERRTLPGESPEDVLAEIRGVVEAAGEEAEVRSVLDRAPLTVDSESAVVQAVREAATEVTGSVPHETGVAYWMDAAIFGEAGVPTVDYGPIGEGAHAAVEWVDLESVERCAAVLEGAARRFLSDAS